MAHASQPVTPEAITLLEGMGFVTIYDADGNVINFMNRQCYQKAVAEGRIKPLVPARKEY